MPRPITAVIHTQALRQNLEVLMASVPDYPNLGKSHRHKIY